MPQPNDPAAPGAQDPGGQGEQPAEPKVTGIQAALQKARETLASKGTMVPEGSADDGEDDPAPPPTEEEGEEAADEDDDGSEDPEGEEAPEEEPEGEEPPEGDAGEEEEGEEEEDDKGGDKKFTATLPGRHPGDPDVEIEVEDQVLAERINQLRNNGMRREQFETAMAEIQAAQEELAGIEEEFTVDPAGFVLGNLEEDTAATVALALLTEPKIWNSLKSTLEKLFDDPKELRTLQAEAKAARLETKQHLKEAALARKAQADNARQITKAIDLMVPEEVADNRRTALVKDLTRDIREHIERNKLQKLDPKDLPTIVADRLQMNGIDPLDARKSIKEGKRSRGKPTTKKGPQPKPKSGKQLVTASAKRKQVAAAPGPGKKAAPTAPKKLPAGQTIQERIAAVRKSGGLGTFLGDR